MEATAATCKEPLDSVLETHGACGSSLNERSPLIRFDSVLETHGACGSNQKGAPCALILYGSHATP